MDVTSTSMITGRLFLHHRRMKRLTLRSATPYSPLVAIFIESAALSTISKGCQILMANTGYWGSVGVVVSFEFVFPLCVSFNHDLYIKHWSNSKSKFTLDHRFQLDRPSKSLGSWYIKLTINDEIIIHISSALITKSPFCWRDDFRKRWLWVESDSSW